MQNLDINSLLTRTNQVNIVKNFLQNFEENKNNLTTKRGLYIYGNPGSGKTTFIVNILKELGYDVIKYDAGDIRNKSIIETITKHNMADKNIMSLFHKKIQRIVIVMDEIDGMNSGDKGGINSLIKLIRPKKTKKQKTEEITMNPIICIGNYHIDKKIKELMKVCDVIELRTPDSTQISDMFNVLMPNLEETIKADLINYVQGDLRKVKTIYDIYDTKPHMLNNKVIQNIFQRKDYNDDTRKITKKLINGNYPIKEHNTIMNETDRTIVGLLWHENIVDMLSKYPKQVSIPFYIQLLDNMCLADYIDRITFQKQIWQFNEMSSLIKTFKNNKIFHDTFPTKQVFNPAEVRFTKVLTKYSTEYNNSVFVQSLCQQLGFDKKDLYTFFYHLKNKYTDDAQIVGLFENIDITRLDINRIYRYLEKYTKEDAVTYETAIKEVEVESDDEEDQ